MNKNAVRAMRTFLNDLEIYKVHVEHSRRAFIRDGLSTGLPVDRLSEAVRN